MKKTIVTLMAILMLVSLVGCGSGETSGQATDKPTTEAVNATDAPTEEPAEPVNITFWHALSGTKGEVFQTLVDEFNASQSEVIVEGVFSGKYAETAEKVTAALATDTLPNGGVIPAGPIFTGANDNYEIIEYMDASETFDMDDFYEGL